MASSYLISDKWYHVTQITCTWWEWGLAWLWVVPFRDTLTIHDPVMYSLCKNYVFFFMPSRDWCEKKQPTSPRKFHWVIRIGFDSFLLKQKADVDIPLADDVDILRKASLFIKINILWFLFCNSYYSMQFLLFYFLFHTFLWATILFC